ncbi:MAG: ABC transporter ATP-binding protein [Olegusella sp.]|nr:ABC transporter ATP-binding protein [Olegusella sp.]
MGTILSRVSINKKHVASLLVLMLVSSVTEMMLPTLLASMIDRGIAEASHSFIVVTAVIMAVMAAVTCAASIATTVLSAKISTRFAADLRRQIFYKVQGLSAADVDRFGTASLVTRSTSDVTNVQLFLTMLLRMGVMAPLMAVAGLVLSAATGGKVSSVLNVAIPVLLVATAVIILAASRYSVAMRKKIDQLNSLFLETLEGVRVIRAFNRQPREMDRFRAANRDYARIMTRSGRVTGALVPVIQVVFGVTTAAVMAVGSYYVGTGEMEVGALVANSQYISMILMSVILLAAVVMMFPNAYACAGRISEVLEAQESMRDGETTGADATEHGSVEFRDVTFTYPGAEEPVIRDVSFKTGPGQVTAIIGRTGCGKSSVVKLVPRMYDVTCGHVLVDGVDVRKWRLQDLRARIGYVPQKNVLFTGDIASNLNFGNEDGTQEDWERAARIACADEFIQRKQSGYHEHIAQGGTNLSGGQRQRLAIARAVMKKPEVYLFDDSFSALDMRTDRQLRQNLAEAAKDAAIIMVAQRVSTILSADQILVIEKGEVIGKGTHLELLRTCPAYREMATLQLGEEAVAKMLADGTDAKGGEA